MAKYLRIAFVGSRGIPPRYGAFEQFVYQLAKYLPRYGIGLYVSCERSLRKEQPEGLTGVATVYFPVINQIRIISEPLYDIISLLYFSLKSDVKVIYLFGYSASIGLIIPKVLRKVCLVNVNGLEWKRTKFPTILRFLLKTTETISIHLANHIICDSLMIRHYYLKRGVNPRKLHYMPYMIETGFKENLSMLRSRGLVREGYYLVVCRLEPENNVHLIIDGFKKSRSDKKLIIVGPLGKIAYYRRLIQLATGDKRISFLGPVYDRDLLFTLRKNCYMYIHGHSVGGTNPSLLEALAASNGVIAYASPFNIEVAKKAALYFNTSEELKVLLEKVESDLYLRDHLARNASLESKRYAPFVVIKQFLEMLKDILEKKSISEGSH